MECNNTCCFFVIIQITHHPATGQTTAYSPVIHPKAAPRLHMIMPLEKTGKFLIWQPNGTQSSKIKTARQNALLSLFASIE